ncbi:terpenoid synthase [Annulohypoxylon maeteangense]|uniref:terpenoid synthase n=1 Tax=Annulohypoxylon maeteangense TaxID=1927788 RepID=UPI0020072AEC|nr:terpenoid synthase [Annulohypoxylon maeteangense]KAI0888174.1 terpenoid synthase [Annulohypoxylon maeteangense]
MLNNQTNVELLLAKCVGQKVKIPDFFAICPWSVEVSAKDEKMEREVDRWRSRWIKTPKSLKRNRIVDPCLFARAAAPKASFDELVILSKWVAWTYYWDDAHDFGEFDGMTQEVIDHQKQTIELYRQCLFSKSPRSINPAAVSPDYLTVQSAHEFAAVVGEEALSSSLKKWTFKVLANSCRAVSRLQHEFDKRNVLDLETYWKLRMDSSAALPTLAIILFTDQIAFPDWFFDHDLVNKAAELADIIISIVNDIASARYELQCKHVDNLIPILVHHKGITPQKAIDEAAKIAHQAYLDFEALEPQLIQLGKSRGATYEMRRFIASCKSECTGIIHWHYHVKRYLPWKPGMDRGNVSLVLGEDLPK